VRPYQTPRPSRFTPCSAALGAAERVKLAGGQLAQQVAAAGAQRRRAKAGAGAQREAARRLAGARQRAAERAERAEALRRPGRSGLRRGHRGGAARARLEVDLLELSRGARQPRARAAGAAAAVAAAIRRRDVKGARQGGVDEAREQARRVGPARAASAADKSAPAALQAPHRIKHQAGRSQSAAHSPSAAPGAPRLPVLAVQRGAVELGLALGRRHERRDGRKRGAARAASGGLGLGVGRAGVERLRCAWQRKPCWRPRSAPLLLRHDPSTPRPRPARPPRRRCCRR
jgi:hypothetical protein